MPSVFAALDVTFRRLGRVPTSVLTDNEKTVHRFASHGRRLAA